MRYDSTIHDRVESIEARLVILERAVASAPGTNGTQLDNPVMGPVARAELGKPGKPISNSRYSAIKRAMGLTGRYVLISQIRAWLAQNPNFSERDVYHGSKCRCNDCHVRRVERGRDSSANNRPFPAIRASSSQP